MKIVVLVFLLGLFGPLGVAARVAVREARERVLATDSEIVALEFSADGSKIAALGERGDFHIWDAASGEVVGVRRFALPQSPSARSISISPRLDEMASIVDRDVFAEVQISSLLDGRVLARIPGKPMISSVRFSRDGERLACVVFDPFNGWYGPALVVSAKGAPLFEVGSPSAVQDVCWTGRGELMTLGGGATHFWSETGECELWWRAPDTFLGLDASCDASADGETFVVGETLGIIDWSNVKASRETSFACVFRRDGTTLFRREMPGRSTTRLSPRADLVAVRPLKADEFHLYALSHGAEVGHLRAKHLVFSPTERVLAWDDGARVHLAPVSWLGRRLNLLH